MKILRKGVPVGKSSPPKVVEPVVGVSDFEKRRQELMKELHDAQAGRAFVDIPLDDQYYKKREELHLFEVKGSKQ